MEPIIVVHGGAGVWPTHPHSKELVEGVKKAATVGYNILKSKGDLLDAIVAAVRVLEESEYFNSGKGSVLNSDGQVEDDAAIMLGSTLQVGGVTGIKQVKSAIKVARRVMENTPHILLAGKGATRFARTEGFEILPPEALIIESRYERYELMKLGLLEPQDEMGTVGAVAMIDGHVVAATSTGGFEGKLPGRVGDSCMVGCGTYADDLLGAVSCTGHGESIAKVCLAHSILIDVGNGKHPQQAVEDNLQKMKDRVGHFAGAITVTPAGEVGISFNGRRMPWAYRKGNVLHFGIEEGDHFTETVL